MSRGRILIVEDEYLVAADLEAVLEEMGYSCAGIAPDAETALALASHKPDLALVDIHLRDGRSGPQIAERLAREHGVNILFVTANPRMALDAGVPGVIGVLSKPCQEETILAALEYALARHAPGPLPAPPAGLILMPATP